MKLSIEFFVMISPEEMFLRVSSNLDCLSGSEHNFVDESFLWETMTSKGIQKTSQNYSQFLAVLNFLPFSQACFQGKFDSTDQKTSWKLKIQSEQILSCDLHLKKIQKRI
jgi:hypothetical protein